MSKIYLNLLVLVHYVSKPYQKQHWNELTILKLNKKIINLDQNVKTKYYDDNNG